MTNIEIRFENNSADHTIEAFAQLHTQHLSETAPSDSYIRTQISKEGKTYKAFISVRSLQLNFDVEETAKSPFTAIEKAATDAQEEIYEWTHRKYAENSNFSEH